MTVLIGEESESLMRRVPNETGSDVENELMPPLGTRGDQGDRIRRSEKGHAILGCWL